jgi:exocyst complex component 4
MTEGNYVPALDLEERDSFIGALETDIVNCDEVMLETLVAPDHSFVMWGLSSLMNELLVYGSACLPSINHNGVMKMRRNILVLRQTLKLIVSNPKQVDFSRAIKFYDLFDYSPNALLDAIIHKKVEVNYNEAKIILRLLHQEIARKHEQNGRRDAALAQRGHEREHLVALHQFYWGSSN